MKIKILFIIFLIFSRIVYLNAQPYGWYSQSSSTTNMLTSVDFVNVNTGWAAGYGSNYGVVIKTTNSGNNWQVIANISNLCIYDIDFINEQTGWVCGNDFLMDPRIFRTTNGGNNWTVQNVPANDAWYFSTVKFVNSNLGFCGGQSGQILKTTNLGVNWAAYPVLSTYDDLMDIFFINSNTGWISGGRETGCIYKTTNSGVNWSGYHFNFREINSIWFFDSLRAYGAGSDGMLHGMINKTTNSGLNWTEQYLTSVEAATSVWFTNDTNGWITTKNSNNSGSIYATTNGGILWNTVFSSPNTLNALFFADSVNGWAVGSGGKIYKHGILSNINKTSQVPGTFLLSQNYPNPFNPVTKIKFDLPESNIIPGEISGIDIQLVIYDIQGRELANLLNMRLKPGKYEIEWDGTNYPSGIYFYKLTAGNSSSSSGFHFTETKKMALVK